MKKHYIKFLLSIFILSGCQMSVDNEIYEDFKIVNGGEVVLDLSDIDYYDFSTHIVYLKENNRLEGDYDKLHGARILVDGTEIYPLKIHELYYSSSPIGPHIMPSNDYFEDFAFRISYNYDFSGSGIGTDDPRPDPRIIAVLKKHNKYRAGLSLENESITLQGNEVKLIFKLRNLDNQSYYHLDPNKMGENLFHYFTNGLVFFDAQVPGYQSNKIPHEQPISHNHWSLDWMSVIGGNETKTFEFTYPFENVPTDRDLRFSYNFPSLERSITQRSDLIQGNGRIWLGSVGMEKMVRF